MITGWIPIKDQLPTKDIAVLYYDGERYGIGVLSHLGGWHHLAWVTKWEYLKEYQLEKEPTHWASIPNLPVEAF